MSEALNVLNKRIAHIVKTTDAEIEKLEAENERLKETIICLKEMQRRQIDWILEELGVPKSDRVSLYAEAIAETSTEMP